MKSGNKSVPTKGRNAAAQAAHFRQAGSMQHKNTERGGAKDTYSEYMGMYEDDYIPEDFWDCWD